MSGILMRNNKKQTDDFTWDNYSSQFYEREMVSILQGNYRLDMLVTNSFFDGSTVNYSDNLHSNWKELYNQIGTLEVSSVFECGTGCAHHLINIYNLFPEIVINGCDYSQSQLDLGYKYFSLDDYSFAKRLRVLDMTSKKATEGVATSEFVFTQAVTMHLSWDRAKDCLFNMGKLSSKYIYLIENINAHNYPELLREALPDFETIPANTKYIEGAILLKKK
jgi:hypothetical protein